MGCASTSLLYQNMTEKNLGKIQGLFKNQDRNITYAHAVRRGMLDADDNVMRCLQCNWELEDDVCLHW